MNDIRYTVDARMNNGVGLFDSFSTVDEAFKRADVWQHNFPCRWVRVQRECVYVLERFRPIVVMEWGQR